MHTFTMASVRRRPTVWGAEVKKRLLDTGMMQEDLLNTLICKGYSMDKQALSNLLYGLGTTKYQQAIREISDILGIPFLTVAGRDDV